MWSRAYTNPRQEQRDFTGLAGSWDIIAGGAIPNRSGLGNHGAINVTETKAMTHSAVWACLRIRADLISTFPASVYRDFGDIALEVPKPPIMVDPGGVKWDYVDWMWASNRDLDLIGNTIGLIKARNGIKTRYYPDGLPAMIELQDTRSCSVVNYKGKTMYHVGNRYYNENEVYHERQYPLSGSPVGLSPIIMAAATIGEYLSLQQYGLDWFAGGGIPKAWMRNLRKNLEGEERDAAKQWYADTVRNGDMMVTGKDWEYNMIQAETAGMEWLEGRRFGVAEVCRFLSTPPEMIHGAVSGQSVTYANVTQANLQFLIMHLGPAIIRREKNLTKLLPEPRYVKLNPDALLRMDPQTRQAMLRSKLETWQLTNTETRALDNLEPLSTADLDEMQKIYGTPKSVMGQHAVAGGNFGGQPGGDQPPGDGQGGDNAPADAGQAARAWTDAERAEASAFARQMEDLASVST
jgi:HK97 family phage portal protein